MVSKLGKHYTRIFKYLLEISSISESLLAYCFLDGSRVFSVEGFSWFFRGFCMVQGSEVGFTVYQTM